MYNKLFCDPSVWGPDAEKKIKVIIAPISHSNKYRDLTYSSKDHYLTLFEMSFFFSQLSAVCDKMTYPLEAAFPYKELKINMTKAEE